MARGSATTLDPRVASLLGDGNGADDRFGRLIAETADPIISRIVRTKLITRLDPADGRDRAQDALELQSEIRMRVLSGLRSAAEQTTVPIVDFPAYVAVVSYNACHEYLRRKHPTRARLKDRLRYILKKKVSGLDLWHTAAHGWLCGRASWRDAGIGPAGPGVPAAASEAINADANASLESMVASLFARVTLPLPFEAVIEITYAALGPGEHQVEIALSDVEDRLASESAHPTRGMEQRQLLEHLWSEVVQLPQAQCVALLLNLRDGDGADALELLPGSGVASFREIAGIVGMTPVQLAAAWPELPWDDTRIAEHLSVSRQQVVNLRKSARARLGRRMRHLVNREGAQSGATRWEYRSGLRIVG